MADDQNVDNGLLGKYKVETLQQAGGEHRQVIHIGSGSSSGTEYDNGASTPATPAGGGIVFDDGGTLTFVSAADPLPIVGSISVSTGFAAFVPAAVSVGTSATAILASSDSGRVMLRLKNMSTTITAFLDDDNGVAVTDYPLRPGEELNLDGFTGTLYGITASSTADVRVITG